MAGPASASGGRIGPGKIMATALVVLGLAMAAGAIATLVGKNLAVGSLIAAIGFGLAGFAAPLLTHWHDVTWDDLGVEGPCRTFGLTLGRSGTMIRWPEIVRVGETASTYRYIESRDGRRVHWSHLYPNHDAFESALARRCAHLADSAPADPTLRPPPA